jgi:phosphate:Na+ symporter
VPDLAVRGLILETERMLGVVFGMARAGLDGGARGRAETPRLLEGVLALGRVIRDFIARLQGDSLPRKVADAVPDILRAIQHLEDAARLAAALDGPGAAPPGGVADAHWRALRTTLQECVRVDPETPGDGADAGPDAEARLRALAEAREDAYQALKRELLAAATTGAIGIAQMESALARAQTMRQCADHAVKARLRLIHARQRAAGETPAISPEHEAPLLNGAA